MINTQKIITPFLNTKTSTVFPFTKSMFKTTYFLTQNNFYSYHMYYLMNSKKEQNYVKIDPKSFLLYFDYIKTKPFDSKRFILILIDCVRTGQKYDYFLELVDIGIKNLNQIKDSLTLITFCSQLFLNNYSDRQKAYLIASRGFQIIKKEYEEQAITSFSLIKFFIFIQKIVGPQRFTNQQYKIIKYQRFKILYLCFTLQIFYKHNLQHYQVAQKILDMFLKNQNLIPFGDIHHFNFAVKTIKQPKFIEFVQRVKAKMGQSIGKTSKNVQFQNQVKLESISYNWFKTFQKELQKKYI